MVTITKEFINTNHIWDMEVYSNNGKGEYPNFANFFDTPEDQWDFVYRIFSMLYDEQVEGVYKVKLYADGKEIKMEDIINGDWYLV